MLESKGHRTYLTLMMTSAQVVVMSVSVITNSPSQDYTHPEDPTSVPYFVFDRLGT